MFDVGFAELFLLALIGLIILGPERLPRVARTLGGLVRKARTSWFALRRSIEAEMAAADMTEPIKSAGKKLKDVARQIDEFEVDSQSTQAEAEKETQAPGQDTEAPDD
jgi:sec-independent protein translocase protein TatB